MSSRLMRALLKLYPRRIRKRYGDELLDLQSELAAKGDLSRTRLIRDVFAGALLVRSSRQRAHVVIGAVLLMVGLAIAVTTISAPGTNPPARASHPELRLAFTSPNPIPDGSRSAGSSSWSPTGTCTFIDQPASTVAPSAASTGTQSGPSCQPASTGSAVSISTSALAGPAAPPATAAARSTAPPPPGTSAAAGPAAPPATALARSTAPPPPGMSAAAGPAAPPATALARSTAPPPPGTSAAAGPAAPPATAGP